MSDQPSITCPQCGMTSYNPNDIRERYCGNCHQYHDTMRPLSPADRSFDEQGMDL